MRKRTSSASLAVKGISISRQANTCVMYKIVLGVLGTALLLNPMGISTAASSIKDAIKEGKVEVDLRYRFELVREDGFSEDAVASTLRLRLGYRTGAYHGVFTLVDFEALEIIGGEQYNSTANGLTDFPVVADPEDEEINQAYIGYSGLKGTVFKLGRQRITLDNHRFVGDVSWRQNEQTFDAFSVKGKFTDQLTFSYAHLNNANRVFGENNPNPALADMNLFGDLINLTIRFPVGALTGYAYLLEFEDNPASSQKNLGARFIGKHTLTKGFTLLYSAEYADQSDYEDGASFIDASYFLAEAGIDLDGLTLKLGYELLEGDGTYAFQTPLATGHAFNGWADKFLTTPSDGLEDVYFSVGGRMKGIRLLGTYHDFSADAGGADYGTEVDLLISKAFKEIYHAGVKYSRYESDGFSTDTDKLWIWLQLKL